MIGLSVQDDRIVHIQDAKSAREAWANLQKVHEGAGTA